MDAGAKQAKKNLTCVWCRAKCVPPAPAGGASGASMSADGYMNLGTVAGVEDMRDTSSCMSSFTDHVWIVLTRFVQITRVRGGANAIMGTKSTVDIMGVFFRYLYSPTTSIIGSFVYDMYNKIISGSSFPCILADEDLEQCAIYCMPRMKCDHMTNTRCSTNLMLSFSFTFSPHSTSTNSHFHGYSQH